MSAHLRSSDDGRGAASGGYGEAPPPAALADRVACLWWVTAGPAGTGARDATVAGHVVDPHVASLSGDPSAFAVDDAAVREPAVRDPAVRDAAVRDAAVHDAAARDPGLDAAVHAILPDGCVDLVWHGGLLTVAGPDTVARAGAPGGGITVGVRLRPGAATTFGSSAAALRDQHPAAEELWGAAGRRLTERVADAGDDGVRLALLTAEVARRTRDAAPTDPAVDAVARRLASGRSGVADLARDVALSERQLRRRFHEHVGYGPKTLDRVLRLQRFLELAITTGEDLAGLAALAGYADQGHLGRETRALARATPSELVAVRRPVGRRPVAHGTSETSETPVARRGRMAA